eukprot:Amastigsp_a175476_23.p6 type:complete len:134 gc:universal Amastigsp_a175476_23:1-402(+)
MGTALFLSHGRRRICQRARGRRPRFDGRRDHSRGPGFGCCGRVTAHNGCCECCYGCGHERGWHADGDRSTGRARGARWRRSSRCDHRCVLPSQQGRFHCRGPGVVRAEPCAAVHFYEAAPPWRACRARYAAAR